MSSAQPKLSPEPASESSDKTLVDGAPVGTPLPGSVADESMALVAGNASAETGHALIADVEANGEGADGVIVDWSAKSDPPAPNESGEAAEEKAAKPNGSLGAPTNKTVATTSHKPSAKTEPAENGKAASAEAAPDSASSTSAKPESAKAEPTKTASPKPASAKTAKPASPKTMSAKAATEKAKAKAKTTPSEDAKATVDPTEPQDKAAAPSEAVEAGIAKSPDSGDDASNGNAVTPNVEAETPKPAAVDFEAAAAAMGGGFDSKGAEAAAAAIRPSWAHVEYVAPSTPDVPAELVPDGDDDSTLLAGNSSNKSIALALGVFLIAAIGIIYAVVGSGDDSPNPSQPPPASVEAPDLPAGETGSEAVAEPLLEAAADDQPASETGAAEAEDVAAAELAAAELAAAELAAAELAAAELAAAELAAAEAIAAETAEAQAAQDQAAQAAAEAQAAAAAAQAATAAERAAAASRNQQNEARRAEQASERRRAQRAAREAAAAAQMRTPMTTRMTTSMSNSGGFTTDNPY